LRALPGVADKENYKLIFGLHPGSGGGDVQERSIHEPLSAENLFFSSALVEEARGDPKAPPVAHSFAEEESPVRK
jgi:hypothetical protein